jgi:hypothetical protein
MEFILREGILEHPNLYFLNNLFFERKDSLNLEEENLIVTIIHKKYENVHLN